MQLLKFVFETGWHFFGSLLLILVLTIPVLFVYGMIMAACKSIYRSNFMRRRRGEHICEEFLPWKTHTEMKVRLSTEAEKKAHGGAISFDETAFQERSCTICGKIEQAKLRHAGSNREKKNAEADDS